MNLRLQTAFALAQVLLVAIALGQTARNRAGSGLAIVDSPEDLTNKHPHLWCRGYGPDNGLWPKAQTTHAEIWKRLSSGARTGVGRDQPQQWRGADALGDGVCDQQAGWFWPALPERRPGINGHTFTSGGDSLGIGNMETFYGYCLAYDAIVDDPDTRWLTVEQKRQALATMAEYVSGLNFAPKATWRVRPTHNFMVLRAADHAAGLYNLRGEPGYEELFQKSRELALVYHNERVNGLGDAPLTNNGPRPLDGFPYEGPNYGAYQASRALIHRHLVEVNEYPNPPAIADENCSGFCQNYNLAWMALALPGASQWADVCHKGGHGMLQGVRFYSAINQANGNEKLARLGEWFHNAILPGKIGGAAIQAGGKAGKWSGTTTTSSP